MPVNTHCGLRSTCSGQWAPCRSLTAATGKPPPLTMTKPFSALTDLHCWQNHCENTMPPFICHSIPIGHFFSFLIFHVHVYLKVQASLRPDTTASVYLFAHHTFPSNSFALFLSSSVLYLVSSHQTMNANCSVIDFLHFLHFFNSHCSFLPFSLHLYSFSHSSSLSTNKAASRFD